MNDRVSKFGLSSAAKDLYVESWRPKTRSQYSVYFRRWITLCVSKGWNKESPQLSQALFFLTNMFEEGFSYGAINTARCVLSNVLNLYEGVPFGQHQVVIRVMKGIYNKRPQKSRYGSTWDADIVLHFLRELSPAKKLTLRELSAKLLVLMLLVTAQRVQTIASLKIDDLCWSQDNKTGVFRLSSVLKHTRRGSLGIITLKAFDNDPRLCVVRTLKSYLDKTEELRGENVRNLFISTQPPFRQAHTSTLARWTKETLANAGIDTTVFKAHSTRGASTSKLAALHIPVREIMAKAQWKSESVFRQFYQKPLMPKDVSYTMLSSFLDRDK